MTNGIDNSILGGLGLGRRAEESAPANKLGQEDFMRLMITQLRNQDPFAPMENGDFLGQLAQFGTVSGIEDVRGALQQMAGAFTSNQALQAAGLVDRQALVPSREAWLPPDGVVSGAVDTPAGTTNVAIGVYDLNGGLVTTLEADTAQNGRSAFAWDGTLPDGDRAEPGFYELRATGLFDGETVSLDSLVSGRVESVSIGAGNGSVALTVTGLGVVDFSRVRGIG